MQYRHDVEGLRAIAVLLVVFFHVNEGLAPGGFVGVDAFFVISGFVITLWMKKAVDEETFSLIEFYRRRVRRILPAMFAVVLISLAAGAVILTPEDFLDLSHSAIFSALSLANVYFTYFLDTGYFAESNEKIPLLHLWSLGVEEQFYLFWPLLVMGLMRLRKIALSILTSIIFASIIIGEIAINSDAFSFAYYMMPTRLFQLAAGGAVVFFLEDVRGHKCPALLRELSSIIGLGLLLGSAFFLNSESSFPGWNAAPLTLGVVLIIISGSQSTVISKLLTLPPMIWIGRRSYSIYLWHWPVLAFQRYVFADLSILQQIGSLISTFVLGHLSYAFIEERYRRSTEPLIPLFLKTAVAPTFLVGAAWAWAILSVHNTAVGPAIMIDEVPTIEAEREVSVDELTLAVSEAEAVCIPKGVTAVKFRSKKCIFQPIKGKQTRILLWGDSNAAHYVGAINEVARKAGVPVQNIAHNACPPLLHGAPAFAHLSYRRNCAQSIPLIKDNLPRFDTIILGAQWGNYFQKDGFAEELRKTVETLAETHSNVFVMGQIPTFERYDSECMERRERFKSLDCEALPIQSNGGRVDKIFFDELSSKIPNLTYIDTFPYLCPDGQCSPYMDGRPIYTNGTHLGYGGSVLLGKMMADDFAELFIRAGQAQDALNSETREMPRKSVQAAFEACALRQVGAGASKTRLRNFEIEFESMYNALLERAASSNPDGPLSVPFFLRKQIVRPCCRRMDWK